MLESLREAACEADGRTGMAVRDFTVHRPLVLTEKDGEVTRWQVSARKIGGGSWHLELHDLDPRDVDARSWRLVASGRAEAPAALPKGAPLEAPAPDDASALQGRYAAFGAVGVQFGTAFRTLRALRAGESESIALLALQDAAGTTPGLHPTLLDARPANTSPAWP